MKIKSNSSHIICKKRGKPGTSYGSRADSTKANQRISNLLRDYENSPWMQKRSSVDARNIITIYASNHNLKEVTDLMKCNMRKRITQLYPHKKRFLSNKSLLGIQHNTKEMTRKINMTRNEKFRRTAEFGQASKSSFKRPQTTQCVSRKHGFQGKRPSTKANWTVNSFTQPISIFDNNNCSPFRGNRTTAIGKPRLKTAKRVSREKSYQKMRNRLLI